MDQLDEQRLREEVIFLHSLWYQGPTRPAYPATAVSAYRHRLQPLWYQGPPVPAAIRPTTTAVSGNRYHLQPSKSTKFKKGQKRKGKSGTILPNNPTPDPNSSHDAEWPCPATPPPPTSWPAACRPNTDPLPLIPEEQSKLDAKGAHQRALKAVREFFNSNSADGSDEIDSGDDSDGDETTDNDCGREEFNFFCKVFENTGFRECYEKNFITGEFSCLVCGVVGGKKTTKKFKGCLSLVQHSIAIGNKRRRAHRALAQAVCKILGWEINRLPEIVSMLSNKLGNTRGNANGDNKESSVAFVRNGDSAKDDTVDDKDDDEAAPASDRGRNLEDIGIVQSMRKVEEPASGALTMPLEATQLSSECNSSHLPSTSGWPTTDWATFEKSNVKPLLLSAEEQLIVAGRYAHEHAIKVVHEFFSTSNSDDFDEIDSNSDDDDEADLMEEDSGSEECSFFFKVFEDDTKLREYYLKNFADGEFSCVVCGAMGGKKTGKKFKGCLPLVQHSITICKTKKRKAHRAFGRAVCKVLGWDIDRLPTVESMQSDKAGNTPISLTHTDGDKDLEHPGMGHEKITEEPASQDLTIVPLNNEQSHGEWCGVEPKLVHATY